VADPAGKFLPATSCARFGLGPRRRGPMLVGEQCDAQRLSDFCDALTVGAGPAIAQNQPQPAAKPGPYKAVAVRPPQAISEPAFEAVRKQMGEAAQRRQVAIPKAECDISDIAVFHAASV